MAVACECMFSVIGGKEMEVKRVLGPPCVGLTLVCLWWPSVFVSTQMIFGIEVPFDSAATVIVGRIVVGCVICMCFIAGMWMRSQTVVGLAYGVMVYLTLTSLGDATT